VQQFIHAFRVIPRRTRKRDLGYWLSVPCALSAIAAVVGPTPVAALQTYAIEDVTVIPMDRERKLERHTVIVRDGRVAESGEDAGAKGSES
jgi:hypothetical protein